MNIRHFFERFGLKIPKCECLIWILTFRDHKNLLQDQGNQK